MEEKTLVLEGLPGDLEQLRPKLELYFKNRRKSGGEVAQIRDHPGDRRKALLIYLLETDFSNVLKQGTHKITFKPQGVVELTVKRKEENDKKAQPPLSPCPDPEPSTTKQGDTEVQTAGAEVPKGKSKTKDLLISSVESVDKDFLALYFEQFTEKAGITKHGKNKWILKVDSHLDALMILSIKNHEFGLTVELYKEADAASLRDPRRFVLVGFKDTCKCKLISVFIGSCSQKAAHTWELIDEERIVVTFQEAIDSKSFLEKCAARNLQGMEIEASCLELTDSVLVQGDVNELSEDVLTLYFGNKKRSGGGDVKSIRWLDQRSSVVISFQDCHAAQEVVEREHHHLCGTDLNTLLFYSSLQTALTGKTPTCSEVLASTIIPVDEVLQRFIENNQKCKNDFEKHLKEVHADAIFSQTNPPGGIRLEMALDKESLAAVRLGTTWESKAHKEAQGFLSRYSAVQLPVEVEIWRRVEEDCLGFVTCDAEVTHVESESKVSIVGLKADVATISDKMRNIVKVATAELDKERNAVEKVVQFDSKQALELVENCVRDQLQNVTATRNEPNLTLHLRGLRDCVGNAENVIKQAQQNVVYRKLNLSTDLLRFLKSLDLKTFAQHHFAPSQISALFLNDGEKLGIVAEKRHVEAAEDKVKEILREKAIQLTADVNTLMKTEDFVNFLNRIKVELGNSSQDVNVIQSEAQVVVCGFAQPVDTLSEKIKDYLENKIPATEYVHLKSWQEVTFVDSCMNLSEVSEIRNLGATVRSRGTTKSPCLKVTAPKDKIQDVVTVIKRYLSAIRMEKLYYSKAGESKVLLKHEANVQAKAKEWHCKACISTFNTGTSKVFNHEINTSITLTVAEGDLQHFAADALVCPMTSQLAFDNPVAQRFLQVAGSNIQAVCNRFQKEKQTLLAGDVVLSDPGNLSTKSLIYTVLPQKDQQSTLGLHYLTSAILNSLQKAESQKHKTIAMPMMGCDTFGFSIEESFTAFRDAVRQLSNDRQNRLENIRNIFVVDSDVKNVDEFNNTIAEMGFHNVKASRTPTKVQTKPQTPTQASDTEVTVHGVLVCLKKGDITNEPVDVIVNSNNKDLNLNTGVSGAILKAAGQSVVDECLKHGRQKDRDVVLTSGGKLSCKHIAQMVGPNNAADITVSVQKVLEVCETTAAATVAVPAIGTGKGGIAASDSIGAILAGVENHLTRTSRLSSLRKITVVAFERTVFDAYRGYFTERNNKAVPTNVPVNKVKIKGAWIEIRKGNIANESVRGIVNTTNSEMNLTGGVSGAIFQAAGPLVQQECQKHGPLQGDAVAVTGAGNLQCDFLIHMVGPRSAEEARLRVKKVLERCEEKQVTTVSFPAIGTGGGGLNSSDAVSAMLQGFHDHLSQQSSTVLKLIFVVIDRDEVLNHFQQGMSHWTANAKGIDDTEESEEAKYSEDDSGETTIGPIRLKVLCGDITKETTDAIVSSTNTTLSLGSGVSGAILKAAGESVVDECQKLGVQPSDGVALTTAGNLPFKHIVHMVGQTKQTKITNCMYKVLKTCEENQIGSVSFPALGTGAGKLSSACVANAMMDALVYFAVDSPVYLKTVHIVIFQPTMLSDFEDAVKTFKSKSSAVTPPKPAPQTSTKSPKQTFNFAAELAAVTFPFAVVEIYGTSSTDMAEVRKFLDDLVSEECFSKEVQSDYITKLPDADKQATVKLSLSNQVHVLVAAKDKLVVSGKKEDVLDVELNINTFIQAVRNRECREVEEIRMSKILHWDVAEGETWQPLNSSISYELELAFQRKDNNFVYRNQGETFTVNFKEMKRVNSKGESCKVERTLIADSDTAIIQPPPSWTKMNGNDLEIVLLSSDSEEYTKLEREFLRSSQHNNVSPVQVVQIQRIQSQSQWQRYCVLKRAADKKYPKQKNERFLYHGTTKEICQKINKNGFNRSFCGRNAVHYGDGTYFAKDAWYSCQDQYSNSDENGLKYIYRARVVTGSPCQSRKRMKEPDPLDPNDPGAGLHDCAVDRLQNPFIFVVFCDAGAYPDYLISFKNV